MVSDESNVSQLLEAHLKRLLSTRTYPKTICPSEAPRALSESELKSAGVSEWRELMPEARRILWNMRAKKEVEILQRGQLISQGTADIEDVKGPLRARKICESDVVS